MYWRPEKFMIMFLAWLLIGSSVFVSMFYLSVYKGTGGKVKAEEPDEWPSVSVLIPAFNEKEVVHDSIENLLDLDYPALEIVFVDDASTDGTREKAEKFSDRENVKFICHEENKGKAAALNTALEEASGRLSVVQDADSVIEEGMIEEAVAKMEADSGLGAVIGRIQPLNENSFFRRLQINEYTLTNFYRHLMCKIDTLDVTPGAFSLYRTKDLRDVGGFDVGNLTEDLDMAWRLRKEGKSMDMVYRRTSYTELPETFSDLKGQRVRWARGFMQNARKHLDMFFNSQYGWFGKFQLPVQAIVPIIAVIGLGMIMFGVFEAIYNAYIQFTAVGITLTSPQVNIIKSLLSIQWKIYTPLIASLVVTGYLIREAYDYSEKPVKHLGSLAFYFFAFFAVKAYFWSTAIFKELFSKSRVWT